MDLVPSPHRRQPAAGNALVELHSMLEPDRGHVLEVRLDEHDQDEHAGDPPDPAERSGSRGATGPIPVPPAVASA